MEISKLHINKQDYNFFTELEDKEKIMFLHDAQFMGKNVSLAKLKHKKEIQQSLNNLFQDTLHEEIISANGKRLIVTTMSNYLHLNSNSLKLIRTFIHKLFNDGHILMRNKTAKKLSGVDNLRYYRCYEIIGSGYPFCPN